jgi:hypothetical protein
MAVVPEKYLQQLRNAGLHVSAPKPALCDGVWVCKPIITPGNNIPGFEDSYISLGDEPPCPDIDAPMLKFYFHNEKWKVNGQDSAGGMGPADFIDEWLTPEEAVQDILDFYFGNPERMAKKAAERARVQERLA